MFNTIRTKNRFEHNGHAGNGFKVVIHGYTISVQWEIMNYCANRSPLNPTATNKVASGLSGMMMMNEMAWEMAWATNVEIAVVDPDGKFVTEQYLPKAGDQVASQATMTDFVTILNAVYFAHHRPTDDLNTETVEVVDETPKKIANPSAGNPSAGSTGTTNLSRFKRVYKSIPMQTENYGDSDDSDSSTDYALRA